MLYKDFNIVKTEDGRFKILDKFNNDPTKHTYKTRKEAKELIDNILLSELRNRRFMAIHYSRWWWAVIDKQTNLYVKRSDEKLLLFKNRQDCLDWCNEHNGVE